MGQPKHMLYEKCPMCEGTGGTIPGSFMPCCKVMGVVETGATAGQLERAVEKEKAFKEFRSVVADVTRRIGVAANPQWIRQELEKILNETKFRD